MQLKQMAERCPQSILHARGILYGYRWQINDRGVANVVLSQPIDVVEGIVFKITARDEKRLDRNEGVSRNLYQKEKIPIELRPLAIADLKDTKTVDAAEILQEFNPQHSAMNESGSTGEAVAFRSSDRPDSQSHTEAVREQDPSGRPISGTQPRAQQSVSSPQTGRESLAPEQSSDEKQQKESRTPGGDLYLTDPTSSAAENGSGEFLDALVYLSYTHQEDGDIREEYVHRMHLAIMDAKKLGMPEVYVQDHLQNLVYPEGEPQRASYGERSMATGSDAPRLPADDIGRWSRGKRRRESHYAQHSREDTSRRGFGSSTEHSSRHGLDSRAEAGRRGDQTQGLQ